MGRWDIPIRNCIGFWYCTFLYMEYIRRDLFDDKKRFSIQKSQQIRPIL